MDAKFIILTQTCTLSKIGLSQLVVDYVIPQNVRVMLPKRNKTIFDAPLSYIGLYTYFFTFSNLRIPLPNFVCPASNWLTLSNRIGPNVPKAITRPITHIEGWKEIDFRSFIMEGIDDELHFSPKGGARNEEGSSPSMMFVNNETLVTYAEPLTGVPPSQLVENTADSDDVPLGKYEVILIDRFVADKVKNRKVGTSLKVSWKRKQTIVESSGREAHQQTRKVPPQASKASSDPFDPLDVDSDP
ncbi:hypothetical protein Tco_1008401 [Tanacetum coccineum]